MPSIEQATTASDPQWYKDAVIYQTHVKAFFDANNDGVGDLEGLIAKLDYIQELGVSVLARIEDAIQWADALNILRLQLERMHSGFIPSLREYNRVFGVTRERLARAPRDLVIMHPGPMNRGVEIDSDVADGEHSVILPQVTNGVAVRMAVLYLLAGGLPESARAAGKGEDR